MAEPADDLPEIKLDDIVGDTPRSKRPSDDAPALELDIDFGSDEAPAPPAPAKPSPAAAMRSVATKLALDPDGIDIALGDDLAGDPSPDAPVLPDILGDEPEPILAKPMTQSPQNASLDLEALLADLDASSEGGGLADSLEPEGPAEVTGALEVNANDDLGEVMTDDELPGDDLGDEVTLSADEAEVDVGDVQVEDDEDLGEPLDEAPLIVSPADHDAPPLPISADEPPPITRLPPGALMPDPSTFEALRKLAGPAGDPEGTRRVLEAALAGQSYDPRKLPDARPMIVALMRVMVDRGVDRDELIEAILAALTD